MYIHSLHWGIKLPRLKNSPPLFLANPPLLKSANCLSPPFLGNHPSILVFREPPPHESRIFLDPH